jgi:allene oxide cyclase
MRNKLFVLAITGALAIAVGGTTLASATSADANFDRVIRLQEIATEFAVVDVNAAGPTVGDSFVFHADLFNRRGDEVGTDGGTCTQTTAAGEFHCVFTLSLAGGDVTGEGLIPNATIPFEATLAITGGTDAYVSAGGEIRVEQLTEEQADLTVRLILPGSGERTER